MSVFLKGCNGDDDSHLTTEVAAAEWAETVLSNKKGGLSHAV
jgi:hypothetical protein